MIRTFSRRAFLRGVGVSLSLPVLESFGASSSPIRRTVAINIPLGFHGPNFFPKDVGSDYKLSPYLEPAAHLRSKFTVFSGMSHPGVDGGHSAEKSFLTAAPHPASRGFKNTVSLDQVIARKVGGHTRFAALTLGDKSLSYSPNGVPIPTENSPARSFANFFLAGTEKELSMQRQQLQDGHSVLDSVLYDTHELGRRVSSRDKEKLEEFYTAVRETEKRLVKAEDWLERPKPSVDMAQPKDVRSDDIVTWLRAHFTVMRLALQTDSTRVIAFSSANHSLVPPLPGVTMGYHGLSHHGKNPDMIRQLEVIDRGTMEAWVEFVEGLDSIQESEGSLLDHTQVLMGSNLGNASAHFTDNLPVLFAGGDYRHQGHRAFDRNDNEPLCNLFVNMLQWMGVEQESFGSSTKTIFG